MWWQWTEITLLDSFLFSVLSIVILYTLGSGFLRLIAALTKKNPLDSFDFLQKTNFRIFFGFVFVFLTIFLLSVLNISILISSIITIVIAALGFVLNPPSLRIKLPKKSMFRDHYTVLLALIVLLGVVFLSSAIITGFYGSTNDDGAFHTLIVSIILKHPNVLITRNTQPYANFFLIYPSAAHVLCAFFVATLSVPIQKIVMMTSVIFPALITLSFYSTSKCLFKSKLLAFVSLLVSAFFVINFWTPIGWGDLPFLMSLYLLISGIGLTYALLSNKMTWLNAFFVGLVFFIASQTYPDALLVISLWFLLVLGMKFFPRFWRRNELKTKRNPFFNRNRADIIISFLTPIFLSVPYYAASFYMTYSHQIAGLDLSQLSVLSTSLVSTTKQTINFNWLIDPFSLSRFFSGYSQLLSLAPLSGIVLIGLLILLRSRKKIVNFDIEQFGKGLFSIYALFILVMLYLTLSINLHVTILEDLFDPERLLQSMFIPGTIMTAIVLFCGIYSPYLVLKRSLQNSKRKISKNTIFASVLVFTLIIGFGAFSFPVLNNQLEEYASIKASIHTYETLDQNDLALMNWIIRNTSVNSVILVSAGDSGQFVSAVTQRQTISEYSFLENYSNLIGLLSANASDLRAIPFLIEYKVSYVYIGSIATTYAVQDPIYAHFNSTQFLSTPYFTLAKQVGNAWLFQFNATQASMLYDDQLSISTS